MNHTHALSPSKLRFFGFGPAQQACKASSLNQARSQCTYNDLNIRIGKSFLDNWTDFLPLQPVQPTSNPWHSKLRDSFHHTYIPHGFYGMSQYLACWLIRELCLGDQIQRPSYRITSSNLKRLLSGLLNQHQP